MVHLPACQPLSRAGPMLGAMGQYKLDSREMGVKLAGWGGEGGEDLGGVGEGE